MVVHRELGLPLDAIRELLDGETGDAVAPLRAQREQVQERIARLQDVARGLDRMIRAHEDGLLLTAEQQAAIFGPDWRPERVADARERWGGTPQWAQYAERAATRSPDEWAAVAATTAAVEADLAEAVQAGLAPGSAQAGRLAERHREAFGAYFPLTREMHVCLGRRFEADAEFAAHYDRIHPGLASWLRRAIDAAARAHGVDPDTATWR